MFYFLNDKDIVSVKCDDTNGKQSYDANGQRWNLKIYIFNDIFNNIWNIKFNIHKQFDSQEFKISDLFFQNIDYSSFTNISIE